MYITESQRTILETLANEEVPLELLIERCGKRNRSKSPSQWRRSIISMDDKLLVITEDKTVYSMNVAKISLENPAPKVKKVERFIPTGKYNGSELGKTCHRPGAYDFMEIPSLRDGERIYPTRNINLTAGIGKTWLGK